MTAAVSPEDRAKILAFHAAGLGRNEIARAIGYSPATVSKVCKAAGVHFDRNATAQAVAARVIDLKARRQAALEWIYDRVDANRARLDRDGYSYRVTLRGSGDEGDRSETVTDDDPPSADERNHMAVITGYLAAAAKLEAVDSDGGATDAASMLSRLAEELGIA